MPWSTGWALIEMPMLFVPRWWPILLLLPTTIINARLALVQWKKNNINFYCYHIFLFGLSITKQLLFG